MSETTSQLGFAQALQNAGQGSVEDIRRLIDEYGPYIQRVVRRRLDARLRSKFDSLDFVQMVWASFFRESDRLGQFSSTEELIRFLVTLARNKVTDEKRRRLSGSKYNVNQEQSLDVERDRPLGRLHTPSEYAIAQERWNLLIGAQSPRDQDIIRLRVNGASFMEISETLGIHERTVRKIFCRLSGSLRNHKRERVVYES